MICFFPKTRVYVQKQSTQILLTSLREATARWRGVSHMLSLALTRAPASKQAEVTSMPWVRHKEHCPTGFLVTAAEADLGLSSWLCWLFWHFVTLRNAVPSPGQTGAGAQLRKKGTYQISVLAGAALFTGHSRSGICSRDLRMYACTCAPMGVYL